MPPRRSTRTASVEPPSAPINSKRKRSTAIDEEEVVEKPQSSRTRRSTSARSTRARAASNKRSASGTLPKVVESDDEQSDEPPPEKKKRPSLDAVEESASEDELPVRKARKAPTKKTKALAKKPQKIHSDEESVGTPPPPPVPTPKRKLTPHRPAEEESDGEEKSLFENAPPPLAPSPVKSMPTLEESKGPQKRLVIHMMVLVNFKSYAGRQIIGPFHKSFSAIVGPNGSGKSNTIDALLFVFGYRASKMRQGKVSELIHNSASHPDLDECSVEVHFREIIDLPGPSDFTVVPDSQLTVARYAYKSNASKYTINDRGSTYNEVQTLLKEKGIDLDHNRFLILQGEVESIAQMKPKGSNEHEDGLLEYLEDIIGTSQYKEPIEKAAQEMEELQDLRSEKMNRLRLVEKEKNALEEKKKEAENYLRLQNEHIRAQSRLWQFYLWTCLVNDEKLSQKITGIEKDLRDEVNKHKDDIEHLDLMHKHYAQRQAAYDEVQAAAEEAAKELKQKEKLVVKYEEEKKHKVAIVKKLRKTVTADTSTREAAHRTITESSEKVESQQQKLQELELSLDEAQKELVKIRDNLKGKTQAFNDQIEVKQRELQPWTAKVDSKQAQIDVATSERNTLVKKAEEIQEQSREADAALQELQLQRDTKSKQREALKVEKEQLQRGVKSSGDRLRIAQENVKTCRAKATSARHKVEEAKSSQAEKKSQNKVLDSLMGLKSTGRVDGFHGRLGSLGKIDDKYDIAISTACGALNNMVVDTVDQGQACINYLRSQNVGRASFMVLDKLGNLDMRPINTPESVPRLFDLITPKEPRFAPAFYKAISNTLVAKDMEQANRIAFGETKRWRVVTLAGQLIDISGTMSGGGTQPARGGMSSKFAADTVSPEALRRYEQEHEQAQKALGNAIEEEKQIEADLEKLTKRGPEIEVEYQKLGMEIETGKKRITEAEKRAKDLSSQTKPDVGEVARIASLDKEIQTWTEELRNLQDASSRIEKDIKNLEQKILDVGGSKLLAQKSKVEGINLHITLANEEITKAEVSKAKAEKDLVKLAKSLEEMAAQVEVAENEVAGLDEKLVEVHAFVQELSERVDEAKTAAENSKDDLRKLKKELDKKTEEVQGFRQREIELKQSLDDAKKESADNEAQLQHWQDQHETLKLEEIDEDDGDEDGDNEDSHKDSGTPAPPADAEGDVEMKLDPDSDRRKVKDRERTPSMELHTYSTEELSKFRKRELVADVELLAEKLQRARPNLSVLSEYKKKEEDFFNRAQEVDNVTKQRDEQKATYDGLRKRRLDEFMAGFGVIGLRLKEMYQMITLGGNAELELVDSMDPFSEGIVFSVMPPKKSWKNISNLSGGEKTLSSLALVFALHVFKPTPLYFMDEIDAALDFRNVSIVANYIKDRTKNAQFIIISLRNDMFELSHRLIGIYKTSNMTKSICINNTILKTSLNNDGGSNPATT